MQRNSTNSSKDFQNFPMNFSKKLVDGSCKVSLLADSLISKNATSDCFFHEVVKATD